MKTLKIIGNCCLVFLSVIAFCVILAFVYIHFFVDDNTIGINNINDQLAIDIVKEDIKIASEIKDKIEKETIRFNVKVGKDSKVFGSISTKQIAEELKKIGYNADKKNIKIDIPLTSLGTHIVKINLHKKVEAKLKVVLIEK